MVKIYLHINRIDVTLNMETLKKMWGLQFFQWGQKSLYTDILVLE